MLFMNRVVWLTDKEMEETTRQLYDVLQVIQIRYVDSVCRPTEYLCLVRTKEPYKVCLYN